MLRSIARPVVARKPKGTGWSRDHEIRWLASHLVRIKKWSREQAIDRVLQLSKSQRLELRRKVYKTVCEMSRASRPRSAAQ